MSFPLLSRLKAVYLRRNTVMGPFSQVAIHYNFLLREFPGAPLPFRGKTVQIRHKSIRGPVWVRLGSTDWYVLSEIFESGDYDFVASWKDVRIDTILDLGANVGFSILKFSSMFPEAVVKGIEPDCQNIALARINCREISSLSLVESFVGPQSGFGALNRADGEWACKLETANTEKRDVRIFSLPEILEAPPYFKTIDLMKCDIEGAEVGLFENCRKWINLVKCMIVETHPPYSVSKLVLDLEVNGGRFSLDHVRCNGSNEVAFLRNLNLNCP